ncbi:glycosyltransferase [candidate division WOR-3 bacterium]|nr:glycosyltransferase [candidate division WOR-3 bacterium]
MAKGLRLGVYINHTHLSDGKFTVTNSEALTFIERLELGQSVTLAVSVARVDSLNPDDYRIVLEKKELDVIPLPGWRSIAGSVPRLLFSFPQLLKKALSFVEKCDLIWLRVPSLMGFLIWWVARKRGKPCIIHVVSNPLLAPRRPQYRGLKRLFAYIFSYVLYSTLKIMTHYGIVMTAGGELNNLLSSTKHPVFESDDILVFDKDLREIKNKKGKSREILYIGRFDYGKGIDILIDSVIILKKGFPNIRLKMAGDGVLLEPTRKRVMDLKMERFIDLLGYVSTEEDLWKLFGQADIVVVPSDSYPEGFPRVVLETWAAGVPLVATKLAGIPYRVKDGENGLLVNPGSIEELTDAIRRLILDSGLRFKIAQGGRQTIERLTYENQSYRVRGLINKYYPGLLADE